MYVSAFAPSPRSVTDAKWFEAYQAVEYRNPDTYSVNGYVGMQAMAEGAAKADSFDRNKVADALRNDTIPTLLSNLRFEPNGDLRRTQDLDLPGQRRRVPASRVTVPGAAHNNHPASVLVGGAWHGFIRR